MSFEKYFQGKSILVTGAGRGIGRALSLKLDELGATVYAVSKNVDNLTELKSKGKNIQIIPVDLGNWEATRNALDKIPLVNCLVNNAGICPITNFMDVTPQHFDMVCDVNLKAVINVSQVVAKKLIDSKEPGSIVNIATVGAVKAVPMVAVYSTLKAALLQLTKIMAIELGPYKIRVNAISPNAVKTDLMTPFTVGLTQKDFDTYDQTIPLKRAICHMDEIVNTILFYLSDLVSIITGTNLPIDGGFLLT